MHCEGQHWTNSPECPKRQFQKELRSYAAKNSLSFPETKRALRPRKTKNNNQCVHNSLLKHSTFTNSITVETPNTFFQFLPPTNRLVNNNQKYSSFLRTNCIPTKTSKPPQKDKHFSNNNLTTTYFSNGRSEISLSNVVALNSTTSNQNQLSLSIQL